MNSCYCGKRSISKSDCTCNTFDPQTNRPSSTVDRFCLKRRCTSKKIERADKTDRQVLIYDKKYLKSLGIDNKFAGKIAICLVHYTKGEKKYFWDNFGMKNQMCYQIAEKEDIEKGCTKKHNLIKIADYGPNSVPELQ